MPTAGPPSEDTLSTSPRQLRKGDRPWQGSRRATCEAFFYLAYYAGGRDDSAGMRIGQSDGPDGSCGIIAQVDHQNGTVDVFDQVGVESPAPFRGLFLGSPVADHGRSSRVLRPVRCRNFASQEREVCGV
jgi:hypothetical protein